VEVEEIRRAVEETIESVAPGTDPRRIRADRPLRQQIDLDSLDWLNVIARLGDRLAVEIPESDHERLATLDSMVAYLASRPARAAATRSRAGAESPAPLPCTRHVINGTTVTVRPIRHDDMALQADFVGHLSAETRYDRFMVTLSELPPAKLSYLTDVDQVRHVALVATVERDGQQTLVGVVRYVVDAAGTGCEFAVAVDDAWEGSGLAGLLMHVLIDVARSRGLASMEGIVLARNTRMLKFTRQLGFAQQRLPEDRGTVRIVRAL
jgi:acetyltransferase